MPGQGLAGGGGGGGGAIAKRPRTAGASQLAIAGSRLPAGKWPPGSVGTRVGVGVKVGGGVPVGVFDGVNVARERVSSRVFVKVARRASACSSACSTA